MSQGLWHIPGCPGEPGVTHTTHETPSWLRNREPCLPPLCRHGGNPTPGSPGCDVEESLRVRMDADKATNAFTRKIKKLTGIGSL